LRLAKGHKPGRPESQILNDSRWNLIQHCWSPIEERPAAEAIIPTIQQFLSHCSEFPPLCDLLRLWSDQADLGAESSTEGSSSHVTPGASDEGDQNRITSLSDASSLGGPQETEQRRASLTGKQPSFRETTADRDIEPPHKRQRV